MRGFGIDGVGMGTLGFGVGVITPGFSLGMIGVGFSILGILAGGSVVILGGIFFKESGITDPPPLLSGASGC
jgi:uncharacterized integral membrane protein